MNFAKYQGLIPAFYACYDHQGNISPEAVRELTRFYVRKGVKGLYVGGSSGECIYQSIQDRKTVLENVVAAAEGKLTIIAHVACNNTKDSRELAAHAESLGVDAIAAIPPIYFKLTEAAIAAYWNDISAAAPNTDFIIYNIPQLAGVALTLPLLNTMLKNPRVIGVKNSSMPVQDIQMFRDAGLCARGEKQFVVFNGPDEQIVGGMAMGAAGGIGGTYGVAPELYIKLWLLIQEGNTDAAWKLQGEINEIIACLCSGSAHMYAVIKAVLKCREGLDIGGVREPLMNITEKDDVIVEKSVALIDLAVTKYLAQ